MVPTVSDTLHKLVYEHSTKQTDGRGPAGDGWNLPERSVVIMDEASMVDTYLLHQYAEIAEEKNWRTILVGDHRQLDAVDAGGMFAELVNDPDVVTVELDTLHRFEHDWEADASHQLRLQDPTAIDTYQRQGRIHDDHDQAAAIGAVADEAFDGIIDGRDVLVMAPTNAIVDTLNTTLTERLVDAGWFHPDDRIDIAGRTFYRGQPVVTRSNNRTLTYGPDSEWVRNGDRWTVNAATPDELYLTNLDNHHGRALPVEYIAAGHLTVDYASTVNRAQGATVDEARVTVDEARVIIGDRTNAKQLYVGATRGRCANHIHTAPPEHDPDNHSPTTRSPNGRRQVLSKPRSSVNPTVSARSLDGVSSANSLSTETTRPMVTTMLLPDPIRPQQKMTARRRRSADSSRSTSAAGDPSEDETEHHQQPH